MSRRRLIHELRRRNVLRAVVSYWVVAWTCIEVSSVVEQALGLPSWLDQLVVILAAVGLPAVVLLSWIFEWGPNGMVIDPRDSHRGPIKEDQDELARRIASEVYLQMLKDTSLLGKEGARTQ